MGQPVVHFEIIGKDGKKLIDYYSQLFGWEIDASNPMGYGVVQRDGNTNADGAGIGGGVAGGPDGYEGHVMFYIEGADVAAGVAQGQRPRGPRLKGPRQGPGVGGGAGGRRAAAASRRSTRSTSSGSGTGSWPARSPRWRTTSRGCASWARWTSYFTSRGAMRSLARLSATIGALAAPTTSARPRLRRRARALPSAD